MKKHVTITVNGKVQGVGFRYSAIEQAVDLELKGIIKNYESNKVVIEVEGETDNLKHFLKWCHIGPSGAKIEKVDYQSSDELQNYENFAAEW
jgi:acylphosphatase